MISDAGKTTTTERMLLAAGITRSAGNVDDGDTIMDHMDQERERGITIQAAATAFGWKGNTINLIDTPGHIDFTVEVERATRVLDGAALIVDAVAGAQAQTETVWRQARSNSIPAVAFVNKMDREGADFDAAVASLEARLNITALPLQRPLTMDLDRAGAIDLVSLEILLYSSPPDSASSKTGGRSQRGAALTLEAVALPAEGTGDADADEAHRHRHLLVERVAELEPDGEVAEAYLEEATVDAPMLKRAIRSLTLSGRAVPVLCGASLKGVGVESLLDAICDYLPSPGERPMPVLRPPAAAASGEGGEGGGSSAEGTACAEAAEAVALAFKVVHDPRSRRPIVWLRVYSGEIAIGSTLLNSHTAAEERPTRLLQLNGEESTELKLAGAGSICAAVGLKRTRTGDTLLLRPSEGCSELRLAELRTPTPVFFSAVEVGSHAQQKELDAALEAMCLEDPSVVVRLDPVTGQQLIGGMGELHLQIVADRLRREHKLDLYTGAMQVAYREGISTGLTQESTHASTLGGAEDITIALAVKPLRGLGWVAEAEEGEEGGDSGGGGGGEGGGSVVGPPVRTSATKGVAELLQRRELKAALEGLESATAYGELNGYPVYGLRATLLSVRKPKSAGAEALRMACAEALALALAKATPVMLEPLMSVELRAPERHVGAVLTDLTGKRRADIDQLVTPSDGSVDDRHIIRAEVPLSALIGYADSVRSLTQGEAAISMEFARYRALDAHAWEEVQAAQQAAAMR